MIKTDRVVHTLEKWLDKRPAHGGIAPIVGDRLRADTYLVITSYSIHYTKLYDRVPSASTAKIARLGAWMNSIWTIPGERIWSACSLIESPANCRMSYNFV